MDIGMPIKDGYEASKEIFQIKNNLKKIGEKDEVKINNKCEIIALTSFSDYQTFEICKRIGMKEVINKPINYKELHRIVLMHAFDLRIEQYNQYL
jgi:CheY-like chemotaxis protein